MNAKNDETKQGHYLTSTDIISLKEVMKWFNIWRAREGSGGPDIDKPRDAFPVFFAGEVYDTEIPAATDETTPSWGEVYVKTLVPILESGIEADDRTVEFRGAPGVTDTAFVERVYNLSDAATYSVGQNVVCARIGNGHWVIIQASPPVKIGFLFENLAASEDPRLNWNSQPSATMSVYTKEEDGSLTDSTETIEVHSRRDTEVLQDTYVEAEFKQGKWMLIDANCSPTGL